MSNQDREEGKCGVCGERWTDGLDIGSGYDICASCVAASDGVARELPHVRIGRTWYYQDDRLREFREVKNPHRRITFQDFRERGLRIQEMKTYVANFEFGDWALDVRCRFQGHNAYVTNIGRGHWGVCEECKACIFLGANLVSSWREEDEALWRARSEKTKNYRHYLIE